MQKKCRKLVESMPKNQVIDPASAFWRGEVRPEPIPVCRYDADIGQEMAAHRPEEWLELYRVMRLIRSFEEMLAALKADSAYADVRLRLEGPSHLCIGQEAAAVGEAFALRGGDLIFGTHRSHGELLAKGIAALAELDRSALGDLTERDFLSRAPKLVLRHQLFSGEARSAAENAFLYGVTAELLSRRTGLNAGFAGSMHVCCPPLGIMPNNAVVGGSVGLAVGAALHIRYTGKPLIAVANFGDGALGRGPVMESFHFASMDQFKTLWDDRRGGLPILFHVINNHYAMGGQTAGETMGYGVPARMGAGFCPDGMHAERINGNDVFAVLDAFQRKRALLTAGDGPVLLESVTYRTAGHSVSDAGSYRSEEELAAWRAVDPVIKFRNKIADHSIADRSVLDAIDAKIAGTLAEILHLAADETLSPSVHARDADDKMLVAAKPGALAPALDVPLPPDNARSTEIRSLPRDRITLRDALFEAVWHGMSRFPNLIAYGEENRDWGGICGVYRGLTEALPYQRLFNCPISEAAAASVAAGFALCGGRVLTEIMFSDFLGCCGDELINQLPKWHALSGGRLRLPVVIRTAVGCSHGAQHAQDLSGFPASVPGLTVLYPVTPYDAKGLLISALEQDNPVVFFESQRCYDRVERFHAGGVPASPYAIPIGEPDVKRSGEDLTILTVGEALYEALDAADALAERWSIRAELIDARSLVPFNYEPVLESVRKTGRILLVGNASMRGSFLKNLAADITEMAFEYLKAPPIVCGSANTIVPPACAEREFFPSAEEILDCISQRLIPLGQSGNSAWTIQTRIERAKHGL